MDYRERQKRLAALLEKQRLDALLVGHGANIRYLCGFTGSNGLLVISHGRAVLITDGRYTAQAETETRNARVVISRGALQLDAVKLLQRYRASAVGLEAEHLSAAALNRLRRSFPKRLRLRATSALVEQLRQIKGAAEIAHLSRAVLLGASLFPVALRALRPGATENFIAAKMEFAARQAGAEGMAFDTIVAGGKRSALPHGRASEAPVPRRGFVVLDWGAKLAGYCSDQTRTVHVGRPDPRSRAMYAAVKEAQHAAVNAVRAGVTCGAVDKAARDVLQRAGFGQYFSHSTGHGVGLEIHEMPRIARHEAQRLEAGMVITIEPGIYLPGRGGVRIEDMVAVTERGAEVLTPTAKDLLTL